MKHFESRYIQNWQEMGPIRRTGQGTNIKFGTGPHFWTTGPIRTGPSPISGYFTVSAVTQTWISFLGGAAIGGEPDGAAAAHHGHRHHRRQPQLRQQQRENHQAKKVIKPTSNLQGFTKRPFPSCENAVGKLRPEVVSNSRNKIHKIWERPYSQALYRCSCIQWHP